MRLARHLGLPVLTWNLEGRLLLAMVKFLPEKRRRVKGMDELYRNSMALFHVSTMRELPRRVVPLFPSSHFQSTLKKGTRKQDTQFGVSQKMADPFLEGSKKGSQF